MQRIRRLCEGNKVFCSAQRLFVLPLEICSDYYRRFVGGTPLLTPGAAEESIPLLAACLQSSQAPQESCLLLRAFVLSLPSFTLAWAAHRRAGGAGLQQSWKPPRSPGPALVAFQCRSLAPWRCCRRSAPSCCPRCPRWTCPRSPCLLTPPPRCRHCASGSPRSLLTAEAPGWTLRMPLQTGKVTAESSTLDDDCLIESKSLTSSLLALEQLGASI